jgi:hypothetical protein
MTRPLPLPDPESLSPDERAIYQGVFDRIDKTSRPPDVNAYARGCLNSPRFAAAIWETSRNLIGVGARDDSYSDTDREYINLVLAFDAGYYDLLVFHLQWAIEHGGLRPEAVEAVWEGRDDDVLPEERQLVDYVRAVTAGTVTDEQYQGIVDRFGERGSVEYTMAVAYLGMVGNLMHAFGAPSPSREEMQEEISRLCAVGAG